MARAPFAGTVALVVTLAVAAFALVMPVLMLAIEPVELSGPFPAQNQRAETLAYLLAFAVILPAAVIAGRGLADRSAGDPALPALLAAGLAVAVIAVRLGDGGVTAVLIAALLWWAGAAVVLLLRPRVPAAPAWACAAVLLLAAVLCFARRDSISLLALTLGALAAAVAVGLPAVRLPRAWRAVADGAVVVLLLLAVPDLVIFRPEDAATDPLAAIETGIFQFHHNFLLGPANEVLHGHAMLAGTASQYGVGSIYLLAGWFELAPIGYGTFGLLTGAMTAAWFVAGYGIVRLGGTPLPLAAAALALAVVALAYNLVYPVGALPQSGPLRFGLPMALLLAVVAGERFPAHSRTARAAALAIVGLASIWSLEALVYTLVVYAATTALRTALEPGPWRRRLVREAVAAALACAIAHVLLALATLVFAGQLPDWGEYLAYLREFLFGDLGDLTYDVARWTPSLALGAGYAASAVALLELVRRGAAAAERTALVAIAGMTAYGIALLSYFVDRSQDHILIHVALPGVLTGALWLALLLRSPVPAAVRTGGLASALAVAVLLFAVAWSSIGDRFPDSALAHAAPCTLSIRDALERLWHPPPLNPVAPAGERMLERHMPGEAESLVMVSPDLGIEILLRSGRVDRLLLGDAWEASFVTDEELPELAQAVDALRPGVRMLMDQPARELLARLRAEPSLDPLDPGVRLLAPLQQWALAQIAARFRLRPVAREDGGFTVVELSRG